MTEPCIYVPKELIKDQKYAKFSGESKLFFGILLTNTEHAKENIELDKMIEMLGVHSISYQKSQLDFDLKQQEELHGEYEI
ncbi:MAG: hypothetical protein LIO74_11915 [Ruminococcus sp.]|nr:hypothetical protein [Ruminococcus sp.]